MVIFMPKYYVRKDGLHEAIRMINGKRVAFRGKTDREVERKMREYREDAERGPLFKEVADAWKSKHWEEIERSTVRSYNGPYRLAVEAFGDMRIKKITPADVNAYAMKLKDAGIVRATAQTRMIVLNMIFDYAILLGHIQYNPCNSVKLPNSIPAGGRDLPSDAVLAAVDKSEWLLPFFLLYSGLRRGEACALTYGDIDRANKYIIVNKAVGYDGNTPYLKEPKSEAGIRKVILLDKLAERIPDGPPDALIFPGINGKLINSRHFYNVWKRWETKMGIKVTPHQLRHGFATLLLEAGLDTKDAQDQLGHASEAVTKDIYEHIRETRRKVSAEKLNATAEIFATLEEQVG